MTNALERLEEPPRTGNWWQFLQAAFRESQRWNGRGFLFHFLAVLMLAAAGAGPWATPARAALVFSDAFAYASGTLAGNNGGSGWSSAWAGGSSLVTAPLPGTYGTSVPISDNASVTNRLMTSPVATGSPATYYLSFVFNADPFSPAGGGDYAGVSLMGTGTSSASLFVGTPGSSGTFGFDWQNEGDGLSPLPNDTNYLAVLAIAPGSSPGKTLVSLYASNNLLVSGSALVSGTAMAFLDGADFTFGGVAIADGYNSSTSINLAGLALTTTVDEAVGFTQVAVPEPGSLLVVGAAAAVLGGRRLRRTRTGAG
ncbi:MAG: PEP-CTERM sorting domain-containing protein [Planctomycetota bacterium]